MTVGSVVTPEKFLSLSETIAYRLSGRATDSRVILNAILGDTRPTHGGYLWPEAEAILLQGIKVALVGYGDKRRKMGPLAVIHPLRVASIRCRVGEPPTLIELLSIFLHDKLEDLTRKNLESEQFEDMLAEEHKLRKMLKPSEHLRLTERLNHLTHHEGGSYNEYLANIIVRADFEPEILQAKLSDRLDNTLDVGVALHGIPGQGAFGAIFDLLFIPSYPGLKATPGYVELNADERKQILANLFKNAEFVNVLRTEMVNLNPTSTALRDEVIASSLRIARFLVQDAFATLDCTQQYDAVRDVMDYTNVQNGLVAVYAPSEIRKHRLDGLFLGTGKLDRKNKIAEVMADPKYLARVGVIFLAVFAAFKGDPAYQIKGIDRHGVQPVSEVV